MGEFNKQEFAILLKAAKGSRSAYAYAMETGITRSHISKFLNEQFDHPPKVDTIKKLAEKAHNGVTYEKLMLAAGHLDDPLEMVRNDIKANKTSSFSLVAPPELAEEFEKLGFQLVSFIQDHNVTIEELEKLLVMLRALREKK